MNYQWYPGHMTKAVRQMQEDIKLIDLIIEIVDARIPMSSRNPDIDELGRNKARIVILNKADLADSAMNERWSEYFEGKGIYTLIMNSRKNTDFKSVRGKIEEACREKRERDLKRGIKNRPIRAMIVGIPNVGKSTFINGLTGKASTKTGNKPGVTKGKQWIKLDRSVELLDTPGILWPKFEDQLTGMKLAFIGSINDMILITEELASDLIDYMEGISPGLISAYYDLQDDDKKAYHILQEIGKKRGCLKSGGDIDIAKAAGMLMDDYRAGKLGRITLENPKDY
ncbi:MAG: ribosome biogenesis GTPase YlqF [Lachnospiraceae bacterium]|nr:ribosome biogenesis GTPase YlqF [Lachnospiraceae bacterium]